MPFFAYFATVQGRIAYWDTAEMQTVPWIFGVPHPTGFPAYVMITGIFAHVFPVGTVSWRIAFFCALLMLGCIALVYAAIVSMTGDRLTAACTGWLLAFGTFFWSYGARAEVHAMAAFWAALAIYFALRGYHDECPRPFWAAAFALGMGLATHPIVLFVIPSVLLLGIARYRRFSLRSVSICLGLMLVPLLLYAYLPLRSHAVVAAGLDPALTLGKPPGAAIWNTDNPQSVQGFLRLVTGSDFQAAHSVARIADVPSYASKLQTFGWTMYREFSPIGIVAALIGFAVLLRRRTVVACALLPAILLPAAFALAYPPVVEIERYFFIPMIALALTIGLGISCLQPRYRNMLRIPVAIAAVVLLVTSLPDARLRSGSGAEDLIAGVRRLTPSNAIVVADWTRGTALAYAAYVERSMGRRTIEIAWPYQDLRYLPGWMRERPVYYVGRAITHGRLTLCPVSADYPVYTIRVEPGLCR